MIDHKVHLPVKQFFSIIFYIHLIAVKTKFKIQSFGYIDFYEIVDEKKKNENPINLLNYWCFYEQLKKSNCFSLHSV